ncbi:hypothetical protein [Paracidovorax valerianellae]|uniref:Uncharacterized protein n=1 Tax=Paracidovorax valerianellae TaxID=187868 RepID=A0A1G6YF65_9BURK|nr:hypothetical protein [Paracidovorax valerianellae]MDA8445771.1 hypothetical protein [Paracidovorax valerianellae]SDD89000.1 hypothetical protein SAMN05192589_11048 [Paracidovorax valerianellae]
MKRKIHPGTRAFAAFTVTVLLAVAATAMTLVPEQAVQAADSLVNLPSNLEQMLPAETFSY